MGTADTGPGGWPKKAGSADSADDPSKNSPFSQKSQQQQTARYTDR